MTEDAGAKAFQREPPAGVRGQRRRRAAIASRADALKILELKSFSFKSRGIRDLPRYRQKAF